MTFAASRTRYSSSVFFKNSVRIFRLSSPRVGDEFIYVLSGSSTHLINRNPETLFEGDFCILPPSARHLQGKAAEGHAIKIPVRPSAFTDICTGFLKGQDPKNFMRAFKKLRQMTPSQYRELYHEKKRNR